ncbi:hypothetical protein QR685DRAFT_574234 [Neurospora intermedia]|uniref:Uncharacterized protein n=1 Tax=Neurospora intermedia TaxID=5142 RepID=A0ABR3D3Z1_NEUIN
MAGTTWFAWPLIRTSHRISRYGNCTGMIGTTFTSANGPDDFRDARLKFGQGPVPNPGIEIHQRYYPCRDHGDDLPLFRQPSPAAIHRCKYFRLFPAVKNELGRNNGCVSAEEEEEEEQVPCRDDL